MLYTTADIVNLAIGCAALQIKSTYQHHHPICNRLLMLAQLWTKLHAELCTTDFVNQE